MVEFIPGKNGSLGQFVSPRGYSGRTEEGLQAFLSLQQSLIRRRRRVPKPEFVGTAPGRRESLLH